MKIHNIPKLISIFIITSIILIAIIISWAVYFSVTPVVTPQTQSTITINGQTFNIEIADTLSEQAQGLSDRPNLPTQNGMLFVYPSPQTATFWMKNMQFPLDIIWIRANQVLDLTKNVPSDQVRPLPTYPSPGPIDSVLELNAGMADLYQIKPGDEVFFAF